MAEREEVHLPNRPNGELVARPGKPAAINVGGYDAGTPAPSPPPETEEEVDE